MILFRIQSAINGLHAFNSTFLSLVIVVEVVILTRFVPILAILTVLLRISLGIFALLIARIIIIDFRYHSSFR